MDEPLPAFTTFHRRDDNRSPAPVAENWPAGANSRAATAMRRLGALTAMGIGL